MNDRREKYIYICIFVSIGKVGIFQHVILVFRGIFRISPTKFPRPHFSAPRSGSPPTQAGRPTALWQHVVKMAPNLDKNHQHRREKNPSPNATFTLQEISGVPYDQGLMIRIIPGLVSGYISHGKAIWKGKTPYLWDLFTMVISHLLTGMILQVPPQKK